MLICVLVLRVLQIDGRTRRAFERRLVPDEPIHQKLGTIVGSKRHVLTSVYMVSFHAEDTGNVMDNRNKEYRTGETCLDQL